MNDTIYDKLFKEVNEHFQGFNKFAGKLVFSFDFDDDNNATLSVYDTEYMEDEDSITEDVISIFKECGVLNVKAEWDYDCGDMYDHWCDLNITF